MNPQNIEIALKTFILNEQNFVWPQIPSVTTTTLHQLLDLSASRFPSKLAVYPLASALSLFKDCLCRACPILATTNSGKKALAITLTCVRGPAYIRSRGTTAWSEDGVLLSRW